MSATPTPLLPDRPRILVVDDHDLSRVITSSFCQAIGCTVTPAASGDCTVELFAGEAFDLILIELRASGVEGLNTAGVIRRMSGGAGPPMVAVSRKPIASRDALASAGVVDVLVRPITTDGLFSIVSSALSRKG